MGKDRFEKGRIRDPLNDSEGGATAIEYGLIAALIAVAAIAAMQGLSPAAENSSGNTQITTSASAKVSYIRQDGRGISSADQEELSNAEYVCRWGLQDDRQYVACATGYLSNTQKKSGRLKGITAVVVD